MSACCWAAPPTCLIPECWATPARVTSGRQQRRIGRIRRPARMQHAGIIETISKAYNDDADGTSAYLRFHHARENTSDALRKTHGNDLIYGDMDLEVALSAIGRMLRAGETFLDAGSGYGRVVLGVACGYADVRCVGVEIVQALHDEAIAMEMCVREMWQADGNVMGECEFLCGDFREVCERMKIEADVVFGFCTTWRGAVDGVVEGIVPVVERLKVGARVVLVDGKLPEKVGEKKVVEEWMMESQNAATGMSTVRGYTLQ